jgi:hypothetical protein
MIIFKNGDLNPPLEFLVLIFIFTFNPHDKVWHLHSMRMFSISINIYIYPE